MTPAKTARVSLSIVGDLALIPPWNPSEIAGAVSSSLREELSSDLVIGNLEAIRDFQADEGSQRTSGWRLAAHRETIPILKSLGFTDLNLANNHVLDHGSISACRMLDEIAENELEAFGLQRHLREPPPVSVRTIRGESIALIGFSDLQTPGRNRPGCIPFHGSMARRLIGSAAERYDHTVVFFHDGIEAYSYPMEQTIESARTAIDHGADLVVGTHPHTIQGVEWYENRPIVYSLGNFLFPFLSGTIFDDWRRSTCLTRLGHEFDDALLQKGILLKCQFQRDSPPEIETIPLKLSREGYPEIAKDRDAELEFLDGISRPLQSPGHPVWRERDEIESGYRKLLAENFDWKRALSRLHRIRPRHLRVLAGVVRAHLSKSLLALS